MAQMSCGAASLRCRLSGTARLRSVSVASDGMSALVQRWFVRLCQLTPHVRQQRLDEIERTLAIDGIRTGFDPS